MMKIAMVMAMDENRLIGKDGGMPWDISADLKHFKRTTLGKPVIMGRRTWDSLGKPLPGRTNIVVTRSADWRAEGALRAGDLDQAFNMAADWLGEAKECCVIGGAQLCAQAMPRVDTLYLTLIHHQFSDGDTWLDSYDEDRWRVADVQRVEPGEGTDYRLSFNTLLRR